MKNSSLAVAGATLLTGRLLAAAQENELLGLQLYTVRDDMEKDPVGTLKQLADMGFKNVEHANYVDRKFYGQSAVEFKKTLDDFGLKMPSGHTVMGKQHWDQSKNDFTDAWKYTVEDAAVMGQHFVISPWLDESMRANMDDFKRYMDVFNASGELCKKSGMKFGYHNHDFEFNTQLDGKRLYDLILQYTNPSLVIQQMDMGNMYGAGGRALDLVKQYPGRFASMHVKDEIKSSQAGEMGGYESTILGRGVIPVKKVIDAGRESGGTTDFLIEQESYQDQTPLECAKEDYGIMKKWGY
ncbi:MAG TPA: sugar phosphate isomerase/epimerase [Candidatus Baltobacteraceae bacterium]|nr:sugar phosphate isomerase/epimerase [Candidatus Baltobacteraceae bacterium]